MIYGLRIRKERRMKESVLEAKIEAILFTMGEAVELERIAAAVQEIQKPVGRH